MDHPIVADSSCDGVTNFGHWRPMVYLYYYPPSVFLGGLRYPAIGVSGCLATQKSGQSCFRLAATRLSKPPTADMPRGSTQF